MLIANKIKKQEEKTYMLTVSVNEHFDPYELARHMIKMPETGDGTLRDIKVDIESGRVTFSDGNPSNSS